MKTAKDRYNIIMITIDGARNDRIRKFENFNKLMGCSTFFSQVIAYAPYTIAGMHAIFSGTYGNKNGVNSYYKTYSFRKDSYLTLTEYMKDNGYYTVGDILNDLIVPPQGFDELKVHDELKDNLTQRHTDLLHKVDGIRKDGKNFFLYLHYSNIHTGVMQNVLKKYNNHSQEYFDNKEKNSRDFDGYMEKADKYLGAIMKKIKELEIIEDTIVIVQSDHGISVGDKFGERAYGAFCYDYTVKAFTFFVQPEIFPPKEIKQLVRTIDTMPTIIDVLGFKIKTDCKEMGGKSMMPLVRGGEDVRHAFIEAGNPLKSKEPPKEPNVRAIRTSKWKFIHNYWDDSEELYNVLNDPDENNNLIKENKEVARDLKVKLDRELGSKPKAIIIAAGKSTRLKPLTDNLPKCLLPINDEGKTILGNTINVFNDCDINNIIIIRGYRKEKINFPGFKYYEDDIQNGILSSLMYAKEEMNGPFIATYSDILFEKEVVDTLLAVKGDIVAVVDTDWQDYYEDRTAHPFSEAENVILDGDKIIKIGKTIDYKISNGEFIGMIKCSEKGVKIFREIYEKAKEKYKTGPFQEAPRFKKAYLTDLIQEIIDEGYEVKAAKIKKGWAEFDTVQDYERFRNQFARDN